MFYSIMVTRLKAFVPHLVRSMANKHLVVIFGRFQYSVSRELPRKVEPMRVMTPVLSAKPLLFSKNSDNIVLVNRKSHRNKIKSK